jgi:hypothetical protein
VTCYVLHCDHIIISFSVALCFVDCCFVYLQQGQKILEEGITGNYWKRMSLTFTKCSIRLMVREQNVVFCGLRNEGSCYRIERSSLK